VAIFQYHSFWTHIFLHVWLFVAFILLIVVLGEEEGMEFLLSRDVVLLTYWDLLLNREAPGHELSSSLEKKG